MLIVVNIKGGLVVTLGVLVFFAVFFATRSFTLSFLAVSCIWCWLGKSKTDRETGKRTAAASLFFIPLFYWGMVLAVTVAISLFFDLTEGKLPEQREVADPRAALFHRDEAGLRANESDDADLSAALVLLVSKPLPGQHINVRVKSAADSVLVLVKLPDLRKIRNRDREKLLGAICETAERVRPGVKVFAGIKGDLMYGAISTPNQPMEIGAAVSQRRLWDFYPRGTTPDEEAN